MNNYKHKKFFFIGAILLIITTFTIPIIAYIISSQYSATLVTNIAPSFAQITINGKNYKPNSELHLKPQQTKATISASGFQDQEIELNLFKK